MKKPILSIILFFFMFSSVYAQPVNSDSVPSILYRYIRREIIKKDTICNIYVSKKMLLKDTEFDLGNNIIKVPFDSWFFFVEKEAVNNVLNHQYIFISYEPPQLSIFNGDRIPKLNQMTNLYFSPILKKKKAKYDKNLVKSYSEFSSDILKKKKSTEQTFFQDEAYEIIKQFIVKGDTNCLVEVFTYICPKDTIIKVRNVSFIAPFNAWFFSIIGSPHISNTINTHLFFDIYSGNYCFFKSRDYPEIYSSRVLFYPKKPVELLELEKKEKEKTKKKFQKQ